MKTFEYTITDKEGVHARPAGIIVAEAKKFTSKVTVENKGKSGDCKRIFAVMGLCAKFGEVLKITVEGDDEEACAAAMEKVLKENI